MLQNSTEHAADTTEATEFLALYARLDGRGAVILDEDRKLVYFNERFRELIELETEDFFLGQSFETLVLRVAERGDFGPGEPELFAMTLRTSIDSGANGVPDMLTTLDLITPTGRRLTFRRAHCSGGQMLLVCEDTTAKHNANTALRVALSSSQSGYFIYDIDSQESKFEGDYAFSFLGPNNYQKVMTSGFVSVIHEDDLEDFVRSYRAGIKKREPWEVRFRVVSDTGASVWIRTHATPQISENGDVKKLVVFYSDVTSALRIQADMRQAMADAQTALKAKNAFLGRLSHEVRTPMNAVIGIADALLHHHDNPAIKPKLELIQSSAEKIVRIVDETLQHTKLEEDKMELNPRAASPTASVTNVCQLWEQQALKNETKMRLKIDPSVPQTMFFDDFRYEQCLNNLLSNAIKFTPAGDIQVLLTTIERGSQKQLVLAVKDNGIGMTKAQQENIFVAFTQADKSISGRFGGTGLGMNISKQIIELMGGKISVRSAPGNGSVFVLSLPIEAADIDLAPREESKNLVSEMLERAAPEKPEYGDLRVLVVDDNSTNHMVVRSLLETLVGDIQTAENGIEAIELLHTTQFDVVLMDIHMPVMDGIEATLSIRGSGEPWADIPIIALTADPQYQQKRLCRNIGMEDALAKPVKLTDILGAFDNLNIAGVLQDRAA